jgi:hypothetical protein
MDDRQPFSRARSLGGVALLLFIGVSISTSGKSHEVGGNLPRGPNATAWANEKMRAEQCTAERVHRLVEAVTHVEQLADRGVVFRIEAFVDPTVWNLMDDSTRQGVAMYLSICGDKSPTAPVPVLIRHANTGHQLAKFSRAIGYQSLESPGDPSTVR